MLNQTRNHNKIHTLRPKRYGNNGDVLKIKNHDEYIKLITVQKIPLHIVSKYLYKCEGCLTPDHFIAVWETIHQERGYVPEDEYYGHFYIYLGGECGEIGCVVEDVQSLIVHDTG